MPLIADRFLRTHHDEVVDVATGELVRLTMDLPRATTPAQRAACDRLAALRHPLLLPLVDYGMCGRYWFEAHACRPALQVPGGQAGRSAVHLVRFLRDADVQLDAALASRNVRPAVDGGVSGWRGVGVFLQWRPAIDAVRAVIECAGPPGVTAITIHGPAGSGLRTSRLQIARFARLAGYVVIDSRFGALEAAMTPDRHLCVLDWLSPAPRIPVALALAASRGARRHLWIRFCRDAVTGVGAIRLEPLMITELIASIHADIHDGPSAAEIRAAAGAAGGLPGELVGALTSPPRGRGGAAWLHETAPEYVATLPRPSLPPQAGGLGRLERAAVAAIAMAARGRHARAARVLRRCAAAFAARSAMPSAASAALALGNLYLDRGRTDEASTAFDDAQRWADGDVSGMRALIGKGRALTEQGRLREAEAAFRTALLGAAADSQGEARRGLALILMLRGRLESAEDTLAADGSVLLATVLRLKGDLAAAAHAADRAIRDAAANDHGGLCEAHLAAAHLHAALGHDKEVREHARGALCAARSGRMPALRLRAEAEIAACLQHCGVPIAPAMRRRLLYAARRVPPLTAARIRASMRQGSEDSNDLTRFIESSGAVILRPHPVGPSDLVDRFQLLLDAIHDSPDEGAALEVVAVDLLAAVDACSVVIRSTRLGRQAAGAGRPWPGEEELTRTVLDGGRGVFRDGLTPEAAEPIVTGGSIVGAIAARWMPGARPASARVVNLLRLSGAAAAAMLKGLQPAPLIGGDGQGYPDDLLGRGAAADRVRDAIRRAATAPYPVLIEGESGSGKELVARSIHARGPRRSRRFCAVNCAALSDDLLEAELFGHAKGAFTGAASERAGLFEEADQGTLFLDEAGELTPRAQAKLLRALQEGEVRRLGENTPRKVDVRLVAATNRSLEEEVRAGRFRADSRFRLDVIRIQVPPLRERPDEVPWLVERLWSEAAGRVGTRATVGDDIVGALARYDWPGNVRELQNVIASLAVHAPRRGRVPASLLPGHIAATGVDPGCGLDEARLEFERRFIRAALARAGGRRTTTASDLGISRQGLAKIMKRLKL